MRLPLIGPAYTSESPLADREALHNFYLEEVQSPNAPDRMIALPTPGLTLFTTMVNTPIRGIYTQGDLLFVVAGNTLYQILSDGTVNALGVMNLDANPCTFACSGDISHQLAVTSGNHCYCYNTNTGAFADVLTGAVFVIFLNNRFVALDVTTNTIHVSNFNDATVWPAGQDQQRSISGDKWKAMIADGQYMWLFGGQKSDVYQFAGSGNTLYIPVQGVNINYGIDAPFSASIVNNAPEFLSVNEQGSGVFLRIENFAPVKRSTFAVDFAVQSYGQNRDSAVAFTYQDKGHDFYVCNFPDAMATWVDDNALDAAMSWHTRGFWDAANLVTQAYRPQYHAFCFNRHIVGDRSSGSLYYLDRTVATEVDGNGIRRYRRTSPLRSELNRVFYGQLILNMQVGIGTQAGQGQNPQVMARWSNDGGYTWSNEHWASAGLIGDYTARVNWSNTGSGRNRVFEFVMTDPVPWMLVGGYVDAEVGLS